MCHLSTMAVTGTYDSPFHANSKFDDLARSDAPPRIERVVSGQEVQHPAASNCRLARDREPASVRHQYSTSTSSIAFQPTILHGRDDSSGSIHRIPGEDGHNLAKRRGKGFWLCIITLMMASFLIVLDMVRSLLLHQVLLLTESPQMGLGTALPTIINDLHGTEFQWVGSAYGLASTALLPLSGALAQVS